MFRRRVRPRWRSVARRPRSQPSVGSQAPRREQAGSDTLRARTTPRIPGASVTVAVSTRGGRPVAKGLRGRPVKVFDRPGLPLAAAVAGNLASSPCIVNPPRILELAGEPAALALINASLSELLDGPEREPNAPARPRLVAARRTAIRPPPRTQPRRPRGSVGCCRRDLLARLDHLRVSRFTEIVAVRRVEPVPENSPPIRGASAPSKPSLPVDC